MSVTMGREQLFHRILVFFAVFTAFVGIINLAASGDLTLGDLSAAGSTIPGQYISPSQSSDTTYTEGANTAAGTVITNLDFTTATIINQNISTTLGGTWTLVYGQGLVLTQLPLVGAGVLNPSAVIARNAQSDAQGVYTFTCKINNNNAGGDFYIFPRYITGYSGSDLKVVFSQDGVHIKKFPLLLGIFDAGDDYFYPLVNAKDTLSTGSTIITQLIEKVSTTNGNTPDYTAELTVTKDGTALFTTNVRSILPGYNINDQVRHGGAGADTQNFAVMDYIGTPLLDTSASIVSGGGTDYLQAFSSFLSLMASIFGVTPGSLIPFWVWAIIGLPCLGTITFISLEMLRGN